MNYLAHAYFSLDEAATMAGNLISDFVKGKKQYGYPADIQKGIRLHRAIDAFTDQHPAVQQAKAVFRPQYRLYAGAFVDVSFDYFIANDERLFATEAALARFAQQAYTNLQQYSMYIPAGMETYFLRMQQQNWLYNYRFVWGIQKSFDGIVHRSAYLTESDAAAALFETSFFELKTCYEGFLPDLQSFVLTWQP